MRIIQYMYSYRYRKCLERQVQKVFFMSYEGHASFLIEEPLDIFFPVCTIHEVSMNESLRLSNHQVHQINRLSHLTFHQRFIRKEFTRNEFYRLFSIFHRSENIKTRRFRRSERKSGCTRNEGTWRGRRDGRYAGKGVWHRAGVQASTTQRHGFLSSFRKAFSRVTNSLVRPQSSNINV